VASATQAPSRGCALVVVGRGPRLVGDLGDALHRVIGQGEPERVAQFPCVQPIHELVGAATGVGADQHLAADPAALAGERQLPQRIPRHPDVICRRVRASVTRSQQDG
jgi:hypothetical protein